MANLDEAQHAQRTPSIAAVVYTRMSTEHQHYSTENQCDVIQAYAAQHGITVRRTYADEGKSGLRLDGRDALKRLLDDVHDPLRDFSVILVYDVSRWGRFQDADESAYYEYICRRAGVEIHYCAEQFANDGSPVATIVKGVKRAMAAEYSRELSAKVFQGQCRLIQLGYRQGGPAGVGLRRILIDQHGVVKTALAHGEQKSLQTDRVILMPGPPEEVALVQWIFDEFVCRQRTERDIADALNAQGIRTDFGRPWTRATVHQVLTNEKYIGNNVYNRRSFKLKKKRVHNPPEMYVRADGAFTPIVDVSLFGRAQEIILTRSRKYSNAELLAHLEALYQHHGYLSALIIDEHEDTPSSAVYRHRFGSLIRAYHLVGYHPDHDYSYLDVNRRLREWYPCIVADVVAQIAALGGQVTVDTETHLLTVNHEFTVSLVLARCQVTPGGAYRWVIRFESVLRPDITVAVRMDGTNMQPLDYYLFPALAMVDPRCRLAESNGFFFDAFRYDSLDALFRLTERIHLKEMLYGTPDYL